MNWNYRLIRKDLTSPEEPWLEMHEVYYDKRGRITMWTEQPVDVSGASKAEVGRTLKIMLRDLRKPILMEGELEKMLMRRAKPQE